MKHALTTAFAILSFVTLCFAQTTEKPKHNALSFELGKTWLIYNLNYDNKSELIPGGYISYGFTF
jgi:hypothetical protein